MAAGRRPAKEKTPEKNTEMAGKLKVLHRVNIVPISWQSPAIWWKQADHQGPDNGQKRQNTGIFRQQKPTNGRACLHQRGHPSGCLSRSQRKSEYDLPASAATRQIAEDSLGLCHKHRERGEFKSTFETANGDSGRHEEVMNEGRPSSRPGRHGQPEHTGKQAQPAIAVQRAVFPRSETARHLAPRRSAIRARLSRPNRRASVYHQAADRAVRSMRRQDFSL